MTSAVLTEQPTLPSQELGPVLLPSLNSHRVDRYDWQKNTRDMHAHVNGGFRLANAEHHEEAESTVAILTGDAIFCSPEFKDALDRFHEVHPYPEHIAAGDDDDRFDYDFPIRSMVAFAFRAGELAERAFAYQPLASRASKQPTGSRG